MMAPVIYEPWTDERSGAVGFKATDGLETVYIYLNPSDPDEEEPNVFLYIGAHGDPALDAAEHHYNL